MVHSFLMIGQSNMAGRGFLNEVPPIKDNGIKMLRNGRWQVMVEPINYDKPMAGIGLAASFAEEWRKKYPKEEIGLIPCAEGGSSLDEWMPGEALFDYAVFNAKMAQRISQIDGILWHQGEQECKQNGELYYKEKFTEIMRVLREQLDIQEVPLMIGGLGDYLNNCPKHNYYVKAPAVDIAIQDFARTTPNCYYVTAARLQPNPDCLHFNAVSLRTFGVRYFQAFDRLKHIWRP